jgi:hypothetical protein
MLILGPALGGVLAGSAGLGAAFLVDAGSFLVAAAAMIAIKRAASPPPTAPPQNGRGVAEALRYVRGQAWLWGTLLAAAVTLLIFAGPSQVLLPFLVKNRLHAGAGSFGAIRAAAGIGALAGALAFGQAGLPRRFVTFMYAAWALQSLALVGYGGRDAYLAARCDLTDRRSAQSRRRCDLGNDDQSARPERVTRACLEP